MKTKTQMFSIGILLASMRVGFGYVTASTTWWSDNLIPIEELWEPMTCENTSKIYLNQDNDNDGLYDVFFYLNSNFTLTHNALQSFSAGQIMRELQGVTHTQVQYYTPLPHMLYKIDRNNETWDIDNYTFWRASRVFPYNTPVRWIATTPNKVIFEQPEDNDPSKNIISIVYDYRYKYAIWFDGTSLSAYRYNQLPDMAYVGNTNVQLHKILPGSAGNRKRAWSNILTLKSCRNYNLSRCGDGKIDTYDKSRANEFEDEVCDDGPLNGEPGYCPVGCGIVSSIPRCGDEIIQEPGTTPYLDPDTWKLDGMSFELCDDGDEESDTDGLLNGDDPDANLCSSICLPVFVEMFDEVFDN